jgi:RecA-family ATPase
VINMAMTEAQADLVAKAEAFLVAGIGLDGCISGRTITEMTVMIADGRLFEAEKVRSTALEVALRHKFRGPEVEKFVEGGIAEAAQCLGTNGSGGSRAEYRTSAATPEPEDVPYQLQSEADAGGSDDREVKGDVEQRSAGANGHSSHDDDELGDEPADEPRHPLLADCARAIVKADKDRKADAWRRCCAKADEAIRKGEIKWEDVSDGLLELADDHGAFGLFSRAKAEADEAWRALPHEADQKENPGASPWRFVDASELAGLPIEAVRWVVLNRVPALELVLLTGDGAAGKTTIALQLAVVVAHINPGITLDWLGAEIQERGPVLVFTGEERLKMMHSRLDAILRHHELSYADVAGRLKFLCLPEDDATLGRVTPQGKIEATPLFAWMLEQVKAVKPKLAIIEAVVDVLDGDDFKRRAVRSFLKQLRQLTIAGEGAVLLIGHPSVAGITTGSGLSGSTDWHNAVRARMYFTGAKKNDDDDPNARELQILKNQFGPPGEVVRLVWKNGVYTKPSSTSPIEVAAAERAIDETFLKCLDAKTAQGINVSAKQSRSCPRVMFPKMPEGAALKPKAIDEAQERLLSTGRIRAEPYGSASKNLSRLVRVPGAAR